MQSRLETTASRAYSAAGSQAPVSKICIWISLLRDEFTGEPSLGSQLSTKAYQSQCCIHRRSELCRCQRHALAGEQRNGTRGQEREQTKDDKEYFRDHKASPLSEIEVADTRKPITRATDTKHSGGDVIGWKPVQLLTAEETLLRASEIWKENAMRGIPELPHSRRLSEPRGEWF
ncbi:GATA transcription factor 16-like isoform X1 [Hibiscus syriacus]|uniref:GATA transcription factor 16-like isoform X1 n=1 Tax=Hibiscus syriacus TaxID=106335 RepID=A0A6A3C340_HIBSY|nr:GATA transcription factor 16-like isoform X1 [Hibiscus syriacus]